MATLSDDASVVARILDHIEHHTTDVTESVWREPLENYRSEARLEAELACVLRRFSVPFCPSAALPEAGSFVARDAAGTPILAVRGKDGRARAFRNACRHRGAQIGSGEGCAKAFVCRYHGWTYDLDGALVHVPDAYGFPGLDRATRGLVPLETAERHGMVWVAQDARSSPGDASLDQLPPLLPDGLRLLRATAQDVDANWKILAEGFLEGYHIRSTHRDTFYPVQFDNLNVVEGFGRNSRIAFPYRNVQKLRTVPADGRSARGVLTYVYHLFPNVMVATFPATMVMVALEPLRTDQTRLVTYVLADRGGEPSGLEGAQQFVQAGAAEDSAVACSIQRSLASGANEWFEFGHFEAAIQHFHRNLEQALGDESSAGRT